MEGDAATLARTLANRVGGRVVLHSRFGTATVELGAGHIDLVTARREVYPFPGSLPEVEASAIADDLARRDFTINAMALDLAGGDLTPVDPLGGRRDLKWGRIRTIHSQSFLHDPTRLFRALKYEQRLGFGLEEGTGQQFQAAVEGKYCDTVSGDRIRREIEKSWRRKIPPNRFCGPWKRGCWPRCSPRWSMASMLPGWRLHRAVANQAVAAPFPGLWPWHIHSPWVKRKV